MKEKTAKYMMQVEMVKSMMLNIAASNLLKLHDRIPLEAFSLGFVQAAAALVSAHAETLKRIENKSPEVIDKFLDIAKKEFCHQIDNGTFIEEEGVPDKLLAFPVNDLEPLSIRCKNVLRGTGIVTVGDLLLFDARSLARLRNLGSKSISLIQDSLDRLGLSLPDKPKADIKEFVKKWGDKSVYDY